MFAPIEIFRFTISEFTRNLEGLGEEEAQTRLTKADGGQMNAITWAMGHIAGHWLSRPARLENFGMKSNDPTPPALADAFAWLEEASQLTESWLPEANDNQLSQKPDYLRGESVGTGVMRATLHTWFHCGEINAMRQLLGHPEIIFLGDITEHLEWRPGGTGGYQPQELAQFAISEFERGLAGVTGEEAIVRLPKADDSKMNSISWTMGHIATTWLFDQALMTGERLDLGDRMYFGPGADPTPPTLEEMRDMWGRAKTLTEAWLPLADNELLSSKRDFGPQKSEHLGTQLLRAVFHTWFHTGEINAMRQMLGHPEIGFVGPMLGSLEYGGVA
jgi:uncharacterized damage-inducible protein DinB